VSGYLDGVRDQLAQLTEHRGGAPASAPPPQPRRRRLGELLALSAGALVAAAVAAVVLTVGSGHRHASPSRRAVSAHHLASPHHSARHHRAVSRQQGTPHTPSPMRAPAGPVPPGFSPESFTAIGEYTWWLLGTAPCSSPPCTSIVRTDDGGRRFVGIPAPRTSQVDQLRFANPDDGFAYGPQLWVTHDAGADWAPVLLGASVADLEASDGYVYAIVRSGGTGRLMRSPVFGDRWATLPAAGDAFGGLWVQGSTVVLESSTGSAQFLMVSHDTGQTFARYPLAPSVACQFSEPAPPVLWEHCATGMMSGDWLSANGGASYRAVLARGLPELPNSAAFAAASATTAVTGFQRLYRTADAGAHWSPVVGAPGLDWSYLGFTDPTHGVAIGNPSGSSRALLYYTTDGGESYHPVTIR
jgi:photosystem II stability/assembly factor-like uncharacterized protein